MPNVPTQTKCSTLGCKNERSKKNSFCLEHGGFDSYKEKRTKERDEFNAMYHQIGWKKLRRAQLSRQPLCQSCLAGQRIKEASVVDHIFTWSHIGEHAFFNNVFQSLCTGCHADKTKLEAGGVYRRYHDQGYTDHALSHYERIVNAANNA